jgi:hypothetical protein
VYQRDLCYAVLGVSEVCEVRGWEGEWWDAGRGKKSRAVGRGGLGKGQGVGMAEWDVV